MNKKENRMAIRQTVEKAVIRDEQNRRIQFAATNPIKEVLKKLHTTLRGLEVDEVSVSRAKYGTNKVTHEKKKSLAKRLVGAFINPFTAILFCLALVSTITDMIFPYFSLFGSVPEDFDSLTVVIILTMVFISGTLRFVQESRSGNAAEKLLAMITTTCTVTRRNYEKKELPMDDLVVGDIVHLSAGDMIPADVRILDAKDLFVSQASLTGESEPIEKTPNVSAQKESVTDYTNIAFMGSNVISGSATAVVVCVGDHTLFGSMASAVAGEAVETSFTKGVNAVSWVLIRFMLIMVPLVFFVNGITKGDWLAAFLFGVSIAVGLTPEMLPMIVTTCLAKGAVSMSKKQTIVKNLNSIQNFGAIDILCTDKTGTLTQNRMHVQELIRYDTLPAREFAEVVALNTTAFLDAEGHIIGNPTEGALLEWMRAGGEDYEPLRAEAKIVNRLTFSTERKYMATIIESGISGRRILCVKGAPEIVRTMCAPDGKDAQVAEQLLGFQSRAMRTLAVAWAETASDDCLEAVKAGGLHFAAVAAISDPVREDVPAAVARCLEAGIGIKIVTGDTPATAREIARQIGLWNDAADGERNHITGTEFAAMSDEELLGRVQELKIMSRARPLDKQRLVKLLQQRGEVVAVTGDGTNDAPALNFANVGLSMGSGTSVAKDASDITLLDDSFASIATAVMWGRSLYRNIQRFVLFQLTINFAAITICFIGALFGTDMPLTVVQILWVNIIMDTFAAMAMASLPPNPEVMRDKPRPRDEFIITPAMARTLFTCGAAMVVVLLGMLFRWTILQGGLTVEQLTVFFSTFVFLQFWNMFNAKGFETRHSVFTCLGGCREFFLILAAIGVGQVLIVEFGGEVFRTEPLSWMQWAEVIGFTSLLAVGGEIIRAIHRKRKQLR